jgi:hypothetical protein
MSDCSIPTEFNGMWVHAGYPEMWVDTSRWLCGATEFLQIINTSTWTNVDFEVWQDMDNAERKSYCAENAEYVSRLPKLVPVSPQIFRQIRDTQ